MEATMQVNLREIYGSWDKGYALDKHTLSSTPIGYNDYGHMQFDTKRPPAGEALFQLKYRQDYGQADTLADAVVANIVPVLPKFSMIIPMPASNPRPRQPVTEVASAIARKLELPLFDDLLRKAANGTPLKNLTTREEKAAALTGTITINPQITSVGRWNALLVDDLHDSGATLDEACRMLRTYEKIGRIYVATMTWK
jgi:predicted amidophosphoribosyltransferase